MYQNNTSLQQFQQPNPLTTNSIYSNQMQYNQLNNQYGNQITQSPNNLLNSPNQLYQGVLQGQSGVSYQQQGNIQITPQNLQYSQAQSTQQFIPQQYVSQQVVPQQQILPITSQYYATARNQSPIALNQNIQASPSIIQQIQPLQTVQAQTQVQEFRHVERPLQVITVDEIEAPWRLKCATLERQILELQIQIRKNNGTIIEQNVQEIHDDTKVKNLELQKLELEQRIHDDEQHLNDLRQQLEELRQEYEVIITEKITYASNEVETWIKKFGDLEAKYQFSIDKLNKLKLQLAQVEAQDKANQELRRSEVRKSSKIY